MKSSNQPSASSFSTKFSRILRFSTSFSPERLTVTCYPCDNVSMRPLFSSSTWSMQSLKLLTRVLERFLCSVFDFYSSRIFLFAKFLFDSLLISAFRYFIKLYLLSRFSQKQVSIRSGNLFGLSSDSSRASSMKFVSLWL